MTFALKLVCLKKRVIKQRFCCTYDNSDKKQLIQKRLLSALAKKFEKIPKHKRKIQNSNITIYKFSGP